jgi:hypothetical protein
MLAVIVVLMAAVCVLGFASETVERAYASPVAPTETVAAVSLPSNEAALQRLDEAIADDGTQALPRSSPCWSGPHSRRSKRAASPSKEGDRYVT